MRRWQRSRWCENTAKNQIAKGFEKICKENLIALNAFLAGGKLILMHKAMAINKVYHISDDGGIDHFKPRRSPPVFEGLKDDVVFGIEERLLHNYLLPRDCPRVTFYAGRHTLQEDRRLFLPDTQEAYVVIIEANWLPVIAQTTLFCYEFDATTFTLLDECAGYYVSYTGVKPVSIRRIDNIMAEFTSRQQVELRIVPNLWGIAEQVKASTLQFSLIRMRNAKAAGN